MGWSACSRYSGFQKAESQVSAGPRFCLEAWEGPSPQATHTPPQARCWLRGYTDLCIVSSVSGNGSHEGRWFTHPGIAATEARGAGVLQRSRCPPPHRALPGPGGGQAATPFTSALGT